MRNRIVTGVVTGTCEKVNDRKFIHRRLFCRGQTRSKRFGSQLFINITSKNNYIECIPTNTQPSTGSLIGLVIQTYVTGFRSASALNTRRWRLTTPARLPGSANVYQLRLRSLRLNLHSFGMNSYCTATCLRVERLQLMKQSKPMNTKRPTLYQT